MNNAVLQWQPALASKALIFQRSREQQEIGDDTSSPGPGAGDAAPLLLLWFNLVFSWIHVMGRKNDFIKSTRTTFTFCLLTFICYQEWLLYIYLMTCKEYFLTSV